jgi:hypothetical protein
MRYLWSLWLIIYYVLGLLALWTMMAISDKLEGQKNANGSVALATVDILMFLVVLTTMKFGTLDKLTGTAIVLTSHSILGGVYHFVPARSS